MKCPKCGKERVLLKTWKEAVKTVNGETSELTYTQYVCPDEDCQKIQDKELLKKHEDNLERERQRNESLTNSRGTSRIKKPSQR